MTRTTPECWPACPTAPAPSSGLPLCWANPRTVGSSPPMAYGALTSRYPAGGSRVRRLRGADPAIVGGVSDRRDGEIVLELRRLNDDSWTTNVVRNTAPAAPPQAQQGWWLDQLIMRRKRSSVVRMRAPAKDVPSTAVGGIASSCGRPAGSRQRFTPPPHRRRSHRRR